MELKKFLKILWFEEFVKYELVSGVKFISYFGDVSEHKRYDRDSHTEVNFFWGDTT